MTFLVHIYWSCLGQGVRCPIGQASFFGPSCGTVMGFCVRIYFQKYFILWVSWLFNFLVSQTFIWGSFSDSRVGRGHWTFRHCPGFYGFYHKTVFQKMLYNCGICLLRMIKPTVVNCGHVFCAHCIQKVRNWNFLDNFLKLCFQWIFEDLRDRQRQTCPECRGKVSKAIMCPRMGEMIGNFESIIW